MLFHNQSNYDVMQIFHFYLTLIWRLLPFLHNAKITGKAISSQNSFRHGHYSAEVQILINSLPLKRGIKGLLKTVKMGPELFLGLDDFVGSLKKR